MTLIYRMVPQNWNKKNRTSKDLSSWVWLSQKALHCDAAFRHHRNISFFSRHRWFSRQLFRIKVRPNDVSWLVENRRGSGRGCRRPSRLRRRRRPAFHRRRRLQRRRRCRRDALFRHRSDDDASRQPRSAARHVLAAFCFDLNKVKLAQILVKANLFEHPFKSGPDGGIEVSKVGLWSIGPWFNFNHSKTVFQ